MGHVVRWAGNIALARASLQEVVSWRRTACAGNRKRLLPLPPSLAAENGKKAGVLEEDSGKSVNSGIQREVEAVQDQ